jgi:DNA-binding transcriptional ArsR family regulator
LLQCASLNFTPELNQYADQFLPFADFHSKTGNFCCLVTEKNAYLLSVFENNILMRNTSVAINNERLEAASELLRALAHPLRLQIVEFIDDNDAINVNKIYNTLKLEQSITSQHLRILRSTGLVKTERDGKFIHYSVDYDQVDNTVKAIRNFLSKPAK